MVYTTATSPIADADYHPHQAHSLIRQDQHAIVFSTAPPTILPMPDRHTLDLGDLDARLARLERQQQHQHQGFSTIDTTQQDHAAQRRPGSPASTLETSTRPFSHSATTSSTSSTWLSRPSTTLHREAVGLAPGAFSKPRMPRRSRRDAAPPSAVRARSQDAGRQPQHEFKYYGRHGNQWLFNDFSVTDAVARGVRRVFGREAGER